jgi:hypothetical protein
MVENWYAARSKGPVYSVNSAGLVSKPIAAEQSGSSVKVAGSYGVFYQGKVRAIFKGSGAEVAADSYAVSPNEYFELADTLKIPANTTKLFLALYSGGGAFMGNLDSAAVTAVGVSDKPMQQDLAGSASMMITRTPEALLINASYQGAYRLELTSVDGKRIMEIRGQGPSSHTVPLSKLSAGVICVRAHHGGAVEERRVTVR